MVIIGGKIIPCEGPEIEKGYVEIQNGILTKVEAGEYPGNDPETIDASGCLVTPGFVDAHCHVGMWEEGLAFEGDDGNEETDPCTPHLRALDAVNPMDRAFGDALRYGITTAVTGPGSANPVAGQILAMKTFGNVVDDMVLRAPCAMKFALGENPKSVYNSKSQQPITRMAVASIIREQLQKARRYQEDLDRSRDDEEADPPELDVRCEALLPVLRREIKAHFHAHRADDICTALRIIREFNLDGVIIHGTEGRFVAHAIAAAGVPVVCGPMIGTRTKPELRNMERDNAAQLQAAGVEVSINTDAPELPIEMLASSVAVAVKGGYPAREALKLITIHAARAAGIQERVGSLKAGKDGDVLIFDEDPIGLLVEPKHIIVSGKFIK